MIFIDVYLTLFAFHVNPSYAALLRLCLFPDDDDMPAPPFMAHRACSIVIPAV